MTEESVAEGIVDGKSALSICRMGAPLSVLSSEPSSGFTAKRRWRPEKKPGLPQPVTTTSKYCSTEAFLSRLFRVACASSEAHSARFGLGGTVSHRRPPPTMRAVENRTAADEHTQDQRGRGAP